MRHATVVLLTLALGSTACTPADSPDTNNPSSQTERHTKWTNAVTNVRTGPGTQYAIARQLPYGVKVTVDSLQEGWWRVPQGDQTLGYIADRVLRNDPPGSRDPRPSPKRTAVPELQVPEHRVVETEDASFGVVRRFSARVSLPQHYQRPQIEHIAKAVVADLTTKQRVNAVMIFFYGPNADITGVFDVARVVWAPNGRWEDAPTVRAGDYSSFRYNVNYNPPPRPAITSLRPSGREGLLGAPLPEGAALTEQRPGDRASGHDPSESYQVSASANHIAAYFNREMPEAGWLKDGASTDLALFFTKGHAMLGVLINSSGGSFTLMGS